MHLFPLITLTRRRDTTRTNAIPGTTIIAIRTGTLPRGESEGSGRAVKRNNIDKNINNSNNKSDDGNSNDNNNGIVNDNDGNNNINNNKNNDHNNNNNKQ